MRELPKAEEDAIALNIFAMVDDDVFSIDDETRAAIREGLTQADRGELVPDEEIAALWKRHGP